MIPVYLDGNFIFFSLNPRRTFNDLITFEEVCYIVRDRRVTKEGTSLHVNIVTHERPNNSLYNSSNKIPE